MRDQLVTSRSGQLVTDKWRAKTPAQRPAKRSRSSASSSEEGSGVKNILKMMPTIGKALLGIVACVFLYLVYQAIFSASIFQLRSVDIAGTEHSSTEEIRSIVRRAAKASVWKADLETIKAELEKQGWVKTAIVSRVLPDGLRVRITERTPRAIVRMSNGRLMWVDEDAVILSTLRPSDQITSFFMRGWDESGTEISRKENQERIQKYIEMKREWDAARLSERVSEVNIIDVRDVRAQLSGNDSGIEVRLGKDNFGKRLARALNVLSEQRQTSRGAYITYLDVANDQRTTVGHSSGIQVDLTEAMRSSKLKYQTGAQGEENGYIGPDEEKSEKEDQVLTPEIGTLNVEIEVKNVKSQMHLISELLVWKV
jgi:cell division protein FtsQ